MVRSMLTLPHVVIWGKCAFIFVCLLAVSQCFIEIEKKYFSSYKDYMSVEPEFSLTHFFCGIIKGTKTSRYSNLAKC